MIGNKNWKLVLALLAVFTVTLAARSWARGPGRGGPEGNPGHGLVHFGQLVEELIFPCRNDCQQAQRSCVETAESTALSCAAETCDAAIQSARTDCSTDRTSQACLSDVSALITCVQPCTTAEATALTACNTTFRTCVAACSPTPTPTP